jgi:uncharacterized protein YfbU (UPF0304 family)
VQEKEAETFVRKRFTPLLEKKEANFTVEIVKFLTDNDSISNVICKRAEDLNAVSVVRALWGIIASCWHACQNHYNLAVGHQGGMRRPRQVL